MISKLIDKITGRKTTYHEALAQLKAGDIFIDCGANTGQQTLVAADTKATVYAFEPDQIAYDFLKEQAQFYDNIILRKAAVWSKNGKTRLYKKVNSEKDNKFIATHSSSIISEKINVDVEVYEEVETIDIGEFLQELDAEIKILKIDIEGAEYEVLNRILDLNLHKSIKYIFVETHADRIPGYDEVDKDLRERLKLMKIKNINLEWH